MTKPGFLGVYVGNANANDPTQQATFQADLSQFESTVGATPTYIDTFINYSLPITSWVQDSNFSAVSLAAAGDTASLIPVVAVPMASQAAGSLDALDQFNAIASGADDSVWLGIVQGYEAQGFTSIDLRLGWEMNGGWEPWAITTQAEATAYIAAFDHISALVKSVPGINVNVVWNPADVGWSPIPTAQLYPGDQYVDIVAADIYSPVYPSSLYDWTTGQTDATLQQWFSNPANEEHYWSYPDASQWQPTGNGEGWGLADAMAFAAAHGKEFGIAEAGAGGNGTTTGPVDEATFPIYLAQMLLAPGAPKLAFANIWDINVGDGNWDFSDGSRPNEAAAWAEFVKLMQQGDSGPNLAVGTLRIAPGLTEDLTAQIAALISPGQPGDTETVTAVSAVSGSIALAVNGTITYTAPASGSDTITYTVTDQLGDVANGSDFVTVDPGPTLAAGGATVGWGKTVSLTAPLTALITPGLLGDTETITAVHAARGAAVLGTGGSVTYTAPATGSDTLTYTVSDEAGNTVTSSFAITVDPGPSAAPASVIEPHSWIFSIGPQILALVTPGEPGDSETISAVSALRGAISLGAYSTVTYQVPLSGTDTISYTVTDQLGDSFTGVYTVLIDPGPTFAAASIKLRPGLATDLTAQINGLITPGVAGDIDTITAVSALHGAIALGANGTITYTPPATGTDTLTYSVKDQRGDTATGSETVTADPGPKLGSGSTKVGYNRTVSLASQIGALITPGLTGDTETITALSALHGRVTLGAGNAISYTAPASGTDTITYTVTDQLGETATGTYGITVDTGPKAAAGGVVLAHNWTYALGSQILALITPGLAGDTETVTAASALHGPVTVGAWSAITYVAPTSGTDTLTYTVTDQLGETVTSTLGITIDPGPKLTAGSAKLRPGSVTNLTGQVAGLITPGLTGDTETITAISALHGTVTLIGGVITYTAPASGTDTLTYSVKDQLGDTATGSDTISIDPGPKLTAGGTLVRAGSTVSLTSQISAEIKPGLSGDTETITAISAQLGSVTLGAGNAITYTAPASGTDTLTYTVTDQLGATATSTYTVAADTGPKAVPGTIYVAHAYTYAIGPKILALITPGLAGDSEQITTASAARGTLTLGAWSAVTYMGPASGTDTITYTVTDQLGDTVTSTLGVIVDPGPTVAPGAVKLRPGATANLTGQIGGLITPGAPGDVETVTAVSATRGTVSLSGGMITYTAPTSGTATITVTVADAYGDSTTGTDTVTIDPGPKTSAGNAIVGAGSTVSLGSQILALVTPGLAGDSETITAVTATHGSVVLAAGNTVTYTAPASGTDTLTYTVTDQLGGTATGTFAIVADTGPTAAAGSLTLAHSWTYALGPTILALITPGEPGDTETITAASAASGGITLGAWNTVSYVAPAAGPDTITYTVTDQFGDAVTGHIAVTTDPGPTLAAASVKLRAGATTSLGAPIAALITPGLPGDTETITAVSGVNGTVALGAGGAITYTAPASGTDTLTYTVRDQLGDSATGTYTIAADPGPKFAAGSITVPAGKSLSLSSQLGALITPGLAGDTETITSVTALHGTVTLAAGNVVTYTAPSSGTDTLTTTVTDQLGDTATGTYTITIDPGPKTTASSLLLAHGWNYAIGSKIMAQVAPGLAGDTETLIAVTAQRGTVTLGAWNAVTYTAPSPGSDTITYTVRDQLGDTATGSITVTSDPGAKIAAGSTSVTANATVNLGAQIAALITPGVAGDTETITSVTAQHGNVTLGTGGAITYTAPASGTDKLTFTVKDQLGDTATGTDSITVTAVTQNALTLAAPVSAMTASVAITPASLGVAASTPVFLASTAGNAAAPNAQASQVTVGITTAAAAPPALPGPAASASNINAQAPLPSVLPAAGLGTGAVLAVSAHPLATLAASTGHGHGHLTSTSL